MKQEHNENQAIVVEAINGLFKMKDAVSELKNVKKELIRESIQRDGLE